MSRPLHALVINQYFTPEMGPPAARFHDLGRLLVERGHRVTVVTGFPNYPSGIVSPEYRGRVSMRENIDGIQVLRQWVYTSPRLTVVTKALTALTFILGAGMRVMATRIDADVVIATSPMPSATVVGILASRFLGVPLVFDIRDFWPDALAASGRLNNTLGIRILGEIERAGRRLAAKIIVVNNPKRDRLLSDGLPPEKVCVVPHGLDLSAFDGAAVPISELLRQHGVDRSRFLIVYAGVFNPPQGLDILLDAAAGLTARHPEVAGRVQFVLVGDGELRRHLLQRATDEGLTDLIGFLPVQSREVIPSLLRGAGAIVITLRPRRDNHTIPSKIYESLASGRPVLVSANGPVADLVNEANAGIASAAGDVEGLIRNIVELAGDPEQCETLGENGRKAATRFDRNILVDTLEEALLEVTSEDSP